MIVNSRAATNKKNRIGKNEEKIMDEDDEVVKEGENENKIRQKKRIISKNINFNHHPKVNHLFSVLYMFAIYV